MTATRELPELMLTVGETATVLRVGETTVRALIKSGELESVLVTGCRRIRRADLEAYVASLPVGRRGRYKSPT